MMTVSTTHLVLILALQLFFARSSVDSLIAGNGCSYASAFTVSDSISRLQAQSRRDSSGLHPVRFDTRRCADAGGRNAERGRGGRGGRGGGRSAGGRGGRGRGRGGGRTQSQSKTWHALRQAGVKSKNRSKAPKWEKEGDSLYHVVVAQADGGGAGTYGSVEKASNTEEAMVMLSRLSNPAKKRVVSKQLNINAKTNGTGNKSNPEVKEPKKKASAPPHMLWGPLSVGPVLRKSLLGSNLKEPTPVQRSTFPVLTSGKNAIIASPTGSGKSLAFLLPLLASSNGRGIPYSMMLITPTVELALQLQREVNKLWTPTEGANGELESAMHVVGLLKGDTVRSRDNDGDDSTDDRPKLLPQIGKAAILGGTPRSLRALLAEMDDAIQDSEASQEARLAAFTLRKNLRAVVLDEADRLLRTEGKARDIAEARQMRESDDEYLSLTMRKRRAAARSKKPRPQAEQLLRQFPVPLDKLQVVCASATVGRTLRRQLMDLLQSSSLDKTAVLITADGDVRTGKDIDRRKSSLVPDTLCHRYLLLPDNSDNDALSETVAALQKAMHKLEVGPALVFPGRLGVEGVQSELKALGLTSVLGLQDINNSKESIDPSINSWEDTPIFVVGDKFGRGLDVPGIRYVFLLSPPSSAAGYTHLSGRTGRNGEDGTAITLTRPREAHKIVAIADALGLSFEDLGSDKSTAPNNNFEEAGSVKATRANLSELTVPVLKNMLKERGLKVTGTKQALIERLENNS